MMTSLTFFVAVVVYCVIKVTLFAKSKIYAINKHQAE